MTITNDFYNERTLKIQDKQNYTSSQVLNEVTKIELKPSILLMSGGLDTTLLLHMLWAKKLPLHVLSFDYGQEATKELEFVKKHCDDLNVSYEIITIRGGELEGNLGHGKDYYHDDETLVPARNQIFLSIGVSYAIQHGYEQVFYGATAETNPVYLDCSPEFVHQFNLLNLVSDLKIVQIKAPLLKYTKQDIVGLAMDYGVDLRETWSCYGNGEKPCGKCSSCKDRKRFETEVRDNYYKKLKNLQNSLSEYN